MIKVINNLFIITEKTAQRTINSLTLFLFLFLFSQPLTALAQFGPVTPFAGTAQGTLLSAITNIVNALLSFVAVIAVTVIIFSTITALSGRDSEDIAQRARNTIIYALVGLIIDALSAVIVNFIISAIP